MTKQEKALVEVARVMCSRIDDGAHIKAGSMEHRRLKHVLINGYHDTEVVMYTGKRYHTLQEGTAEIVTMIISMYPKQPLSVVPGELKEIMLLSLDHIAGETDKMPSWEGLMAVVGLIEGMREGIYQVDILQEGTSIKMHCNAMAPPISFGVSDPQITTKKLATFQALAEFATRFNNGIKAVTCTR